MVQVTFNAPGTLYFVGNESEPLTSIAANGKIERKDGAVVYIPLTGPASEAQQHVLDYSSKGVANEKYPIFTPTSQAFGPYNSATPGEGSVTYYVPYRSPETVTYDFLSQLVAAITLTAPASGASSVDSVTSTATTTANSTAASSILSGASPTDGQPQGTAGSSESSASLAAPTSPMPTEQVNNDAEIRGGAIGGTIGGLIVGAAGVLLGIWFLKRRRSRTSVKGSSRAELGGRVTTSGNTSMSKEMQVFGIPASNTGWQKHLPQEKDDKTLSRTIKAIFDQVQMYVEDYYNDKPGKIDPSAIAVIGRVSSAGLTNMLISSSNCIPILEAILVRWIVHRISLRSDAGDSFLPFEYTRIPEQNGWHMESDDDDSGHVRESKKGFPQAFSQWRILTVFLHSDPRADRDYRKQLDIKIDHGVRALIDAFSPWEKYNRSTGNRSEGLRSILQAANEAGVLLFAQPSTFVFDWSTREGTITVFPSLVKRLDELGNPLAKPDTLIAAKRSNVI